MLESLKSAFRVTAASTSLSRRLRFAAASVLLALAPIAYAAPQQDPNPAETAAGAAGCSACCGGVLGSVALMVIAVVVPIILQIALMVWVARDSKSRGMDSAVLWMVLVGCTSFIGLILYVFARPQGQMRRCDSCHNSRLAASKTCPHCGNA